MVALVAMCVGFWQRVPTRRTTEIAHPLDNKGKWVLCALCASFTWEKKTWDHVN